MSTNDSNIITKPIYLDENTTMDNSQDANSQNLTSDSINQEEPKDSDLVIAENDVQFGVCGIVRKNFFSELWPFFKVDFLMLKYKLCDGLLG